MGPPFMPRSPPKPPPMPPPMRPSSKRSRMRLGLRASSSPGYVRGASYVRYVSPDVVLETPDARDLSNWRYMLGIGALPPLLLLLGLASMLMDARLPIRLRVLVAAVENSISADAFRPGDVLVARNGKTTEIGNTDAEGRLVLADALVEACSESPELLIDCATLTGASRVALGTDVPSVFCNDEGVGAAEELVSLSEVEQDQVWRLPLWKGYREQIDSKVADLKNIGAGPYGGAITAALYLDEFVEPAPKEEDEEGGDEADKAPPWLHLDIMAYNTGSKPGRPEGGEAMGMRALFRLIAARYGGAA